VYFFINASVSGFMLVAAIHKVVSKCSSVKRVPDFMFFIQLNNCSQMYVLPNVEDRNNACFIIPEYFSLDTYLE
jgi:hypothetical protein